MSTHDVVDYIARYGSKCRDCADDGPICPSNGLPCEPDEQRKAIAHVLDALAYGEQNGFISRPAAPAEASTAARFTRLHGIVSRILWTDVGVPALDNEQTKAALGELAEYLFADGVDAALAAPTEGRDE